jgi:hypothetical protein
MDSNPNNSDTIKNTTTNNNHHPHPMSIDEEKEFVRQKGRLVSDCLLDQSMLTVVGLGMGLAIYMQTRKFPHFFVPVMLGTGGDIVVGYYGCRPIIEDFKKAKRAADPRFKKRPEQN